MKTYSIGLVDSKILFVFVLGHGINFYLILLQVILDDFLEFLTLLRKKSITKTIAIIDIVSE